MLSSRLRLAALVALLATSCSSDEIGTSESAVQVCGQTTVKGVDVYHGDNGGNPIDWNAVANAGMSFAFVKATEGTTFLDSSFATNWSGVKAAGMVRGAYHFFHSDLDPVAQADFFLKTVGSVGDSDLLVLDLETTNGQTQATIISHAQTFMATVKAATGKLPLLYTSPLFLASWGTLGEYPLWVANYGVKCPDVPATWKTYAFWQSTGTGKLSALSGNVDLDTFNGTLADLQALGSTLQTSDAGAADASADAPNEASPIDAAAPPDAGEPTQTPSGGCSCTTSPTSSDARWLLLLAAVTAAGTSRRRTRAARAKAP